MGLKLDHHQLVLRLVVWNHSSECQLLAQVKMKLQNWFWMPLDQHSLEMSKEMLWKNFPMLWNGNAPCMLQFFEQKAKQSIFWPWMDTNTQNLLAQWSRKFRNQVMQTAARTDLFLQHPGSQQATTVRSKVWKHLLNTQTFNLTQVNSHTSSLHCTHFASNIQIDANNAANNCRET